MKDTIKIALLVIAGSITLSVCAAGLAYLYQKIKQEQEANAPTTINCTVIKRVYSADEIKCKVNGDQWIFAKDTSNEQTNK